MKALIRPKRGGGNSQGTMEEQDDDRMDAFAELYREAAPLPSDEEDLEEVIKNELLALKRSEEEKVTLFINYNTGLPSSAAVKLLFSTAEDVLRPKRACLSEANFEHLVFMKGNLHLVKPKFKVLRVVEEDKDML